MSKTYHTMPRQPAALAAKSRKAGYHHDRRAPRGGTRNVQAELLAEVDDFEDECDSCFDIELNDIFDANPANDPPGMGIGWQFQPVR